MISWALPCAPLVFVQIASIAFATDLIAATAVKTRGRSTKEDL